MELSKWINRVVARRSPDNAWVALSDLPNLLARFRFVAECQLSGFPQLEPDCPKTAQLLPVRKTLHCRSFQKLPTLPTGSPSHQDDGNPSSGGWGAASPIVAVPP